METVIASTVTGVIAIIVCLINNAFQNREIQKQNDTTRNLIEYKVDELTKRVDKHNDVITRTFNLETAQTLMDERIKTANHRIEDLESELKHK